jgi:hypothetical protein
MLSNKKDTTENTEEVYKNRCLTCNIDMGDCNPRQLCGKTRCLGLNILSTEMKKYYEEKKTIISSSGN